MNIWVMRHGEAGFNAKTDNQRQLTEKGKQMSVKQGQWLAQRLQEQKRKVDKILVSPYLRTQQTLEQLLVGMQAVSFDQIFANPMADVIETWDGITPSGNPNNVLNYLSLCAQNGVNNVLIISHLPLVYDLVQALTAYQHAVHFYPAVIAEIDWQETSGKLIKAEYGSP